MKLFVFDFETEGIEDGVGAPAPVGLAYQRETGKPKYLPMRTGQHRARSVLSSAWEDPAVHWIGHQTNFDLAVAMQHLGFTHAPRGTLHCTMVQAFLLDPFTRSYALKELAERHLGRKPAERDELHAWLIAKKLVKSKQRNWGKFISAAPLRLTRPYALADVEMTRDLWIHQSKQISEDPELVHAYNVECQILPILVDMQLCGLHLDASALAAAENRWQIEWTRLGGWLKEKLRKPEINLGSASQVMDALVERKLIGQRLLTEKGNPSMGIERLRESDLDRTWLAVWSAWQQRKKLLTTYVLPWRRLLEKTGDSRLHCSWSGTRGSATGRYWGARTGRFVSSPNLQNIPKKMEHVPLPAELKLGPEPRIRDAITPAPGHVLLQRDYSQQELRVLAHYEGGELREMYRKNPKVDVHEVVRLLIQQRTGLVLKRDTVKTTGFSILYGSGAPGLKRRLGVTIEEARDIRSGYLKALPGIRKVQEGLSERETKDQPYYTYNGRRYTVERTREVSETAAGRWSTQPRTTETVRTWGYKALNYLIQGSSADCTKLAMVAYFNHPERKGRLVCSVHDELWVEVAEEHAETEMDLLQKCMESVPFDVLMLTEGITCRKNIGEAKT